AEARLQPLGNGLRRLFDLPLWRVFDTEAAEFVYLLRHIKFFVRDHNHRGDRELPLFTSRELAHNQVAGPVGDKEARAVHPIQRRSERHFKRQNGVFVPRHHDLDALLLQSPRKRFGERQVGDAVGEKHPVALFFGRLRLAALRRRGFFLTGGLHGLVLWVFQFEPVLKYFVASVFINDKDVDHEFAPPACFEAKIRVPIGDALNGFGERWVERVFDVIYPVKLFLRAFKFDRPLPPIVALVGSRLTHFNFFHLPAPLRLNWMATHCCEATDNHLVCCSSSTSNWIVWSSRTPLR